MTEQLWREAGQDEEWEGMVWPQPMLPPIPVVQVAAGALLIEDGMTFDQILDAVQALGYICASRPPRDTTMEPGRWHIGANLMALAETVTDQRAACGEGTS